MTDILKTLREAGFKPEVHEDVDFAPFNGKYICRIDSAGRIQGTNQQSGEPFDFRSISMQVTEVVDGDKAMNRFVKKNYNPDEAGTKKLLDDLFTAGIEVTVGTDAELDTMLETLKDKMVNVSCWVSKEFKAKDGRVISGGRQASRIVNKFKAKGDKSVKDGSAPF